MVLLEGLDRLSSTSQHYERDEETRGAGSAQTTAAALRPLRIRGRDPGGLLSGESRAEVL